MDENKSVESSLEKLLSFRPSIEDMKLIIEQCVTSPIIVLDS
jgi:hypothetical protein